MNMKKIIPIIIVIAVVVGAGSFYGGMVYGKAQAAQSAGASAQRNNRGQFGGNFSGRSGGMTSGSIIAKDDTSITLKTRDGGSKIVLYSDQTEVSKFVAGAMSDLAVGDNVTVAGTANKDGSITAQTIQQRPAMPPGGQPQPGGAPPGAPSAAPPAGQ